MTKITIDRVLLEQAIEALEMGLRFRKTGLGRPPEQYAPPAIDALRAALAEPAVEPVASIYITPEGAREFDDWRVPLPVGRNELYPAPPPPADVPLLTDEEIEKLREEVFSTDNPFCPVSSKSMRKAARAIEAAVRQKVGL